MNYINNLKIGDKVKFGRTIGEYRGRFDNLNKAMGIANNRLYYVAFEKIEKL